MGAGKSKAQADDFIDMDAVDDGAAEVPEGGLTRDEAERRRLDAPYRRSVVDILAERERELAAEAERRRQGRGIEYAAHSKGGKKKSGKRKKGKKQAKKQQKSAQRAGGGAGAGAAQEYMRLDQATRQRQDGGGGGGGGGGGDGSGGDGR